MSTESPDLPDANAAGNTKWIHREKSRFNLGFPAFILGVFGLALDYLGSGLVGYVNILYYFGGIVVSLALVIAIFTLAATVIPAWTFWSALPSLLTHQGQKV